MDRDMYPHSGDVERTDDLDALPALTCPTCEADLIDDELFLSHRVCSHCGRHFSLRARDRIDLIVDSGSFRPILTQPAALVDVDNDQMSVSDRIAEHRERPVLDEAIVTGTAAIGGKQAVVIALDDHLVGTHIGALGADKIIIGLEHALARRLPVVAICAGGAARTHAGPLAVVQGSRLASTASQLQLAGVPMVALLTHPTSAGVFSSFASQCDLIFAEPGTQLGVALAAGPSLDAVGRSVSDTALLAHGWIDGVVPRPGLRQHLDVLLDLLGRRGKGAVWSGTQPQRETAAGASAGRDAAAALVRHPERPHGRVYLDRMLSPFIELRGDRVAADDRQVICGIGKLEQMAVAVVVQDRTERPAPNDTTAAIRKITRLARLAGRFEMPIMLIVDAPDSEGTSMIAPDEALAIAKLSSMLSMLPVPVVSLAVGQVQGILGGALMTGDRRLMQEHATYKLAGSAIARGGRFPVPPSGSEAVLYRSARECERLGLIDGIIPEPSPAAHADPGWAAATVTSALVRVLTELSTSGPRRLVESRHQRHRVLGQETEEGRAAIHLELRELQEWQHSVAKSIEDWRSRWEQRLAQQPRLTFQRPDLSDLANRFQRPELTDLTSRFQRPDLGDLATRLRARRQELLERAGRADRPQE
jgi:acyl-CoA carboxylase subunit beta